MLKKLLNIRLSYIYPSLFIIFLAVLSFIKPTHLTAGQLALYSVNTFLFGFYFNPILNAQKSRVESLNKAVRQETMTILDILGQSHLLKPNVRHALKVRLKAYVKSILENTRVGADNPYYDEMLRFTKDDKFKGDSVMDTIYTRVSKTQENRDALNNLFSLGMFMHEWLVVGVLYAVTTYFVLQTDYGNVLFFRVLLAILSTGIALMMVILLKYATLTHKQAKRMWRPLHDLMDGHLDDVSAAEVSEIHRMVSKQPD
jgi:hypothetical protein